MSLELSALAAVDFSWESRVDQPYDELTFHIPNLQAGPSRELADKLQRLAACDGASSPPGVAVLGPAGAGKTYLLGSVRKAAYALGQFFILADLSGAGPIDAALTLAITSSLDQPGADGRPQWRALLDPLFLAHADAALRADGVDKLLSCRPPGLIHRCDRLIDAALGHGADSASRRDVLRAVLLRCSSQPDLAELGEAWLSGAGITRQEAELHGFHLALERPGLVLRGLLELLPLARPLVIALDQLDAPVLEHLAASASPSEPAPGRQSSSRPPPAIGLSGAVVRLFDACRRAQLLVACREETWALLDQHAPLSLQGRFDAPVLLRPLTDAAALRSLVAMRLQAAYRKLGYDPPRPCHPFDDEFFSELAGAPPREVYKRCDNHRRECLRIGSVIQTGLAVPAARSDELAPLQRRFEQLLLDAPVARLLAEEDEAAFAALLESACLALTQHENPTRADVDVGLDVAFPGGPSRASLHARVRLVLRGDGDRERHYCFRFLQQSRDRAFQARLLAAMTAAGIGPGAAQSRLAILRVGAPPSAAGSERAVTELRSRGGLLLAPSQTDLAALWAIQALRADPQVSPLLSAWLAERRPVSRMSVFGDAVRWLYRDASRPRELGPGALSSSRPPSTTAMRRAPSSARKRTHPGLGRVEPGAALPSSVPPRSRVSPSARAPLASSRPPGSRAARDGPLLPVGERLGDGAGPRSFEVPLLDLRNHAMVLAGEGSAKTALLKRLIEEAVLHGVPAIIVDGQSQLSLLGDERTSAPDGWMLGDDRKARLYHERSDVVIWTPGIHRGNPLSLEPLPDLGKLAGDRQELEAALSMVVASLGPIVAPSAARAHPAAPAVLLGALRDFARRGGGGLRALMRLLAALPAEAAPDIPQATEIARQMCERLEVECKLNPLLGHLGATLDPGVLLEAPEPGKTRVSVINLSGLPSERSRQQFVDHLAMALFTHLRGHPARHRPLLGLLVLDEARDFVPATRSVPSKESLLRLVPQARKHGLGILFATEAPKAVDPQLIAGCATHFYGRVSSPAAIETVREQLRRRGGSGSDVATLMPNVFYAHTDGMASPVRLAPRPCLSAHPSIPPTEHEIIQRAQRSRAHAVAI